LLQHVERPERTFYHCCHCCIAGVNAGLTLALAPTLLYTGAKTPTIRDLGALRSNPLPTTARIRILIVFQLAFGDCHNGAGGAPEVNFANAGNNAQLFGGTALLNCPQIVQISKPARLQARQSSSRLEEPHTVKVVSHLPLQLSLAPT